MSRVIALDHGGRRIGVAVADRETGMAFARPAIKRRRLEAILDEVADLCAREGAELVVIGLPRNMDGSEGVQAQRARAFGEALNGRGLRVAYEDERLSSWEARQRLAFGTVESWLVYKLTGGAHLSDATNASRTSLLPLQGGSWDPTLCDVFGVPAGALPDVVDCAGRFGETLPELFGAAIPLTGLAGDQQAATIGQGCLSPGDTKATFGTGAFVLANMGGRVPSSRHRLLGTVLHQLDGQRCYALEGSIFVAGSMIQWLRDSLGLIATAAETEALAASVEDSGGVVIVPALSGLGAPHWRPEARASISGLSFASGRAEIVRAALEAMTMQIRDLAEAFAADGAGWRSLKIDGGMSANSWMAQDLADMLDLSVERPDFVETTALGAAMLAGVGAGLFADLSAAAKVMRGGLSKFTPRRDEAWRADRLTAWRGALERL